MNNEIFILLLGTLKIYDEVDDAILKEFCNYKKQRNLLENEILHLPYYRIHEVIKNEREKAMQEIKNLLKGE